MADLLITTADNEQFLAHHGTKGMKWGVWNDETRRKYGYYPASSSKKGQRIIAKAEREYAKADRANSVTQLHMRAMKVNADKITKQYAKSNVHTLKAQRSDSKAKKYADKSEEARTAGDERKARKLDAKAMRANKKSENERNRARAEMDRGHALSNDLARTQVAERQLKREATKHLNKAAKLEAKADKVIKKEDRKAEKAYDTMIDYSKYRLDKYREEKASIEKSRDLSDKVHAEETTYKTMWRLAEKHGLIDERDGTPVLTINDILSNPRAPKEVKTAINEWKKADKAAEEAFERSMYESVLDIDTGWKTQEEKDRSDREYPQVVQSFMKSIKDPTVTTREGWKNPEKQEARLREVMNLSLSDAGATTKEAEAIIDDLLDGYKDS